MKTQTVIITDDLTGEEGAEPVQFTWRGATYEIDLTPANAEELDEILAPYVTVGRRISRTGVKITPKTNRNSPERIGEVRRWAANNGFTLGSRGRIPGEVIAAYKAVHH